MDSIIAALIIASASLIGALVFGNRAATTAAGRLMVPVAVGVFLGVVFFELIPEAFTESARASYGLALGFIGFYVLAHLISQYHHHHSEACAEHHNRREGILILLGDAIHNFVDGIVIAIAFSHDPTVGVATATGLLLHEVPQEIAEFSILIRAGYGRARALFYNFLSATTVILGTFVTSIFMSVFEQLTGILIAVAAGNLLYIAASDLLPDIAAEHSGKKTFWKQFALVAIGIFGMSLLFALQGEAH